MHGGSPVLSALSETADAGFFFSGPKEYMSDAQLRLTNTGLSTYDYVHPDLTKNRDFADKVLFADKLENGVSTGAMTNEERENWPTYSPYSIVTPRISGYGSVPLSPILGHC